MKPKWQKLASLAQRICTLQFQFFGAVFASKGYPFKNIFEAVTDADMTLRTSGNLVTSMAYLDLPSASALFIPLL